MDDLLTNILDGYVRETMNLAPEMSEFEVAFRVVSLNLSALCYELFRFGATGEDLPNDGLLGLLEGLVTTVQWMRAKELLSDGLRQIQESERK